MWAGLLNGVWVLSWIATAAALFRVLAAGALKSHRWLIAFLCLRVVEDPALFPLFGNWVIYNGVYIGFEIGIALLLVPMAAELYRNACVDYPGLRWVATWIVNLAGAVAVLLWVASLALDAQHLSWSRFTPRVFLLTRSVTTVLAIFFVIARAILSRFPFEMRSNTRLQFNVFTLYLSVIAISFTALNIHHEPGLFFRLTNVSKGAICAGAILWLAIQTTKAGEVKPVRTPVSPAEKEEAIRRMEAWSVGVRRLARGARDRSNVIGGD